MDEVGNPALPHHRRGPAQDTVITASRMRGDVSGDVIETKQRT